MTRDDLIQLVNDQRRDTTSNFVDTDEITRYFNQCLRVLQSEHDWDFAQASGAFTYATGTSEYALSAIGDGYWKNPIDIFGGYQHQFELVTPEDFLRLSSLGMNVYSVRGDFLLVNNNTNTTQLSAIFYTSAMAKTSGGSWQTQLSAGDDEPLMPNRFQDILADYALMRIFKKEGLTDDYMTSTRDYERKIQLLKNEYITKTARPLRRWRHISEMNAGNIRLDRKADPLQQT